MTYLTNLSVLGHWNDSGNVSWSLVSAFISLDGKYCEWSLILVVKHYAFNIWSNSDSFIKNAHEMNFAFL